MLYEAGASTSIVGEDRRLSLTIDDVGRLSRRLSEVEIVEEVEPVEGTLLGVLPESHEFELKPPVITQSPSKDQFRTSLP